jgi:FlaA1/EpsC-like NDP-sugar epimerase
MPHSVLRQTLVKTPRRLKQAIVVGLDLSLLLISSLVAMYLRMEEVSTPGAADAWLFVIGAMIAVPTFTALGLYRAIFRYAGLQVVFALNKALAIYTVIYVLIFTVVGVPGVPRSLGLAQPMLFAFLVMSSRLFARHWLGGMGLKAKLKLAKPVLIYGAGSAGRQLANSIYQSQEFVAAGYVDDDDRLHGHILNGVPIFSPQDLAQVVANKQVSEIFLALPSVPRKRRNEIIDMLKHLPVKVLTLPGLMDLTSGKVAIADLKELDIEDLLGREPVPANPLMLAKNITGKVVMVTGAGGSIGSELCRQILKSQPATLLLLELTEFALYQIEQELRLEQAQLPEHRTQIVPLLANVYNEPRMAQIFAVYRPQTVYHAAAYKHVPLVEHNPGEGIRNNVWGTLVTAHQALAHGVRDFVLVSTDKAVRPTNIMGATKRIAEMGLQALAQQASAQGTKVNFSMVRFGNVLGSSGSVVPLFRKQIAAGGPITLTDERITRFFMTIPEAAQLVIQAGAMATGGDVFVLDMGDSVKIMDLARKMIELSGLQVQDAENPDGDIAIEVTGLRPGEKLYEELLIGDNPQPTQHQRIMKAHEDFLPLPEYMQLLEQLKAAQKVNDVPRMRDVIAQLVPGYQPEGGVVDWLYEAQVQAA